MIPAGEEWMLALSGPSLGDVGPHITAAFDRIAAVNGAATALEARAECRIDAYGSFEPESAPAYMRNTGAAVLTRNPGATLYTSRAAGNRRNPKYHIDARIVRYQPQDAGPPEWSGDLPGERDWRKPGVTSGIWMLALLCEVYRPESISIFGMDGYRPDAMYAAGVPNYAPPKDLAWCESNNRDMFLRLEQIQQHYKTVRIERVERWG